MLTTTTFALLVVFKGGLRLKSLEFLRHSLALFKMSKRRKNSTLSASDYEYYRKLIPSFNRLS